MAVVGLDEVDQSDIEQAGGKGANLGELIAAGFPVPPGFVIGSDEYAEFISDISIPANDGFSEDSTRQLSGIREQILNREFEARLSTDIPTRHEKLSHSRSKPMVYAVRSSATTEDLADASFAGQHDTYYYVTPDNINLMVKKCWASLWSDAAFSYRQSHGIEHRSVHMAVVVQEMVKSDVSGVTFTADPVSGSDSVIITESSWGMGAAIVDGRVSPDQYIVDKKTNRLTSIKISDKKFMVPAVISAEQQSRLIEVPAELRRKESLTDPQVESIASLATKAEQHFGSAQDLEWAIEDDEVYLLQSRPITVMGTSTEDVPDGRFILFKPVAKNFTDPLMPLTKDIFARLFPMMEIIHGRMYMRIDHVRALIPFKLSDEDVSRLAYLSPPEAKQFSVSIPRLLFLGTLLIMGYLVMGVFYRRTAAMPDDFMVSFRQYFEKVVADDSIEAPGAMLNLFIKYRFFEPAGNMVMLVNLVAPRYILLLRILTSFVERWTPNLAPDTASLLCSGTEGVLSTEMGRSILNLAKTREPMTRSVESFRINRPGRRYSNSKLYLKVKNFVTRCNSFSTCMATGRSRNLN